MARPQRLRQPHLKYSEDEYIIEKKSKKPRVQKSDAMENSSRPKKAIVAGSKSDLVKGNLHTGRRTVKSILSPVLQDRTNLPREPLKVDLLVKKGTDDAGTVKKPTKTTRKTLKSATSEENEDEMMTKTSSTGGTKRKTRKADNGKLLSAETRDGSKDVNENENHTVSDVAQYVTIGTRVGKRAVAKIILPKKIVESEMNSSFEDIAENNEAKKSEAQSRSDTIGTRVGKRAASKKILSKKSIEAEKKLSPRDIAKSDKAKESEAVMCSSPIGTRVGKRGRSKKILSKKSDEVKKNSSLGDIDENEETAESVAETHSSVIGTRVGIRGMSKKISLTKKSIDNVENETKSHPRSSRNKAIGKNSTMANNAPTIKKFFKSKATADCESINSPIKKTVTAKRRNIGSRQKARMSTSFRFRQMTLSESFAKQNARKVLRPRQAARNYCEVSVKLDKRECADNEESVNLEKSSKKSGPIYKTAKLHDNSDNDKNKIYEFQFDSNDSSEKIRKKRRKRTVRKNILVRKVKATGSALKKITSSEMGEIKKTTQTTEKINDKPDVVDPTSTEFNEPTSPREIEFQATQSDAMEIEEIPINEKNDSTVSAVEKKVRINMCTSSAKPLIVQSVELRGNERINLTSTPQLVKSSETNELAKISVRSSLQYRAMISHALLTKSLSPINRAIESFDPGSPWRPPTFANQQFSRVKNVVQSTPQVRKFAAMLEKNGEQPETRNKKIPKRNEIVANIAEISDRMSPNKALGLAKSPRKFGTVISNGNKIPAIGMRMINEINENSTDNRISMEKSAFPSTREDAISHGQERGENSFEDEVDDKENCTPNPKKSPIKSPSKLPLKSPSNSPLKTLPKFSINSPKKNISKVKPLRGLSTMSSLPKENFQPQAGPSNIQKPPLDDSRILRQSNLNNFLNLDEMPKSTRIRTIHGIFDDAHSTPISGKPIRKINKEPDVENAFGFDESNESSIDISPIKKTISEKWKNVPSTKKQNVQEEKAESVAPMRLPACNIKKHLLPIVEESKNEAPIIGRIEKEENVNEARRKKRVNLRNRVILDPVTFADTFDVMEVRNETDGQKVENIPLFEDIEPAHFKQAPRYSYKRKRPVGFIFSEDEDENKSPPENCGTKKRKISKVEKERQKQMENWANNLNHTFEEIDHFDLVVE